MALLKNWIFQGNNSRSVVSGCKDFGPSSTGLLDLYIEADVKSLLI